MKVCKVVFNSVSHDARVLKEAEAVRDLGHEVVIIGIQDAVNRRPIDLMDNGIAIRRVAWTSAAVRPQPWLYVLALVGIVTAALVAHALVLAVFTSWARLWQTLSPWLTWQALLALAVAVPALLAAATLGQSYLRRQRTYRNVSKREHDELLKFQAELERYRRGEYEPVPGATRAGVPDEAPARAAAPSQPAEVPWMDRVLPRPLMLGPADLLLPAAWRRWKTVWAREGEVAALLAAERPDVVHAHDVTALPVCAAHKRRHGGRLVFDAHEIYDHLAQSEDDLSRINSRVMRKHQGDVDLFVTINESISSYYRVNYPGFPRAVIVKNATPRAEPFEYDGRLHETARLPRDRRILIYQGGYAPKRGLLPLLLSVEYLGPDWTLVFMGWGRLETELRRAADAMCTRTPELAERVRFVPKVPQRELPWWTAGAALGAIPYENVGLNHWFCTPNKLWEYPNAGVPIIASPFPELRRIIEPNEIGWFLPDPLTPKDIGKAVNAITPEMLADARARCLDFITRDNWSVYGQRLKAAYGGLQA